MPGPINVKELMIEAHEDRIQAVESGVSELSAQVAANSIKLENLTEKLEKSVGYILEKIETCIEPVVIKLDNHIHDDKEISEQTKKNSDKIEQLEQSEARRSAFRRIFKKVALPLALAGGGVLATKFAESIWTWMSR